MMFFDIGGAVAEHAKRQQRQNDQLSEMDTALRSIFIA